MSDQDLHYQIDIGIALGRETMRARILAAIIEWKSQGRTPEEIYAMDNFLSGAGKFITEEL
jgi:hypothetical protein